MRGLGICESNLIFLIATVCDTPYIPFISFISCSLFVSRISTDLNVYFESNVYNAHESNGNLLISLVADRISEFPFVVSLQIDSGSASEVLHLCVLDCVDFCVMRVFVHVCTYTFACVSISTIVQPSKVGCQLNGFHLILFR